MNNKTKVYLDTLTESNRELKDLIDVNKIDENIESIIIDLNTLNYIISRDENDFNKKIELLFEKNKDCFKSILILIGIKDKTSFINKKNKEIRLSNLLETPVGIKKIFKETGLLKLILNGKIKNFVDYAVGVEVGIDTNARKNRSGIKVEKLIEEKLKSIFSDRNEIIINSQKKIEIGNDIVDAKVFDIVIENTKTNKKILIESSFYNAGGSKINETAKSYKDLNSILSTFDNHEFIWLADGKGMKTIPKILDSISKDNFIMNHKQFFNKIKKRI